MANHKAFLSVSNNTIPVKSPTLPPRILESFDLKYRRNSGLASVQALSQGERDILELAREALGWPSIISLAHKYYPLLPHRQCWKRALAACALKELRTVTLNIRYLLLAVITEVKKSLEKSFNGRPALNRLTQLKDTIGSKSDNRLTQPGGILNREHVSGIMPPLLRRYLTPSVA